MFKFIQQYFLKENSAGFTLIELLIVISLITIISGLTSVLGFDLIRVGGGRSEKDNLVSLLQRARSKSLNNIGELRHGIHFEVNPYKLTAFSCKDCEGFEGASIESEYSPAIKNFEIISPNIPFDILYDQLSGNCISAPCGSGVVIKVSDGTKISNIFISKVGQIDANK
ncbi:MAG TPA: prepilin-type N-terminal cleavage/methylation domain-containing protein [Candidatus Paceibacterota bacterium]